MRIAAAISRLIAASHALCAACRIDQRLLAGLEALHVERHPVVGIAVSLPRHPRTERGRHVRCHDARDGAAQRLGPALLFGEHDLVGAHAHHELRPVDELRDAHRSDRNRRRAIDRNGRLGRIEGVEALARWTAASANQQQSEDHQPHRAGSALPRINACGLRSR